MSSPFVRPESSFDRLAFLVTDHEHEKIKLFDPSLERVFRCTGCGMDIAVGPCFEHIDPESFLGAVCGCAVPEPLPWVGNADQAAGRAGTSADEVTNG